MASIDSLPATISALGGFVGVIFGGIVAYRNSKSKRDGASDDRAAIAVTNFEQTSVKVDALWDTIKDLITEVAQLKEDKKVQQDQIATLKQQLDLEQKSHRETKRTLEVMRSDLLKAQQDLAETQKQLLAKQDELNKIIAKQGDKK